MTNNTDMTFTKALSTTWEVLEGFALHTGAGAFIGTFILATIAIWVVREVAR